MRVCGEWIKFWRSGKINAKSIFKKRNDEMGIYRPASSLKYLEKKEKILTDKPLVSTWEITSQGITARFDLSRTSHIKSI